MPKTATILLTVAGADSGPFNLLSNADSFSTPFEFNITRGSLLLGYTSSLIPDAATVVRVQSTGSCTNFIDFTFPYEIGFCGVGDTISEACSNAVSSPITLYSNCEFLTVGCSLFYNSDLTGPVSSAYAFAQATWDMNGSGVITAFSSIQC